MCLYGATFIVKYVIKKIVPIGAYSINVTIFLQMDDD